MSIFLKRGISAVVIMISCICMIAGCSEIHNQNEDMTQIETKQELLLWSYYETDGQIVGLDNLMDEYNSSQDEYEISWEYVPMTEFDNRIARAYTEKELPDIVIIDNPDMRKYIQLDIFEDITDYVQNLDLENNYYSASVSTVEYNGAYYGVPFNSNNVCLIYRSDLFEEEQLDPPTDWDEFVQTAQKLTDEDTYGFLMSAIDSEQGAFQLMSWVMAASDSLDRISEDSVAESYTLLADLINKGYMPADCINYNQTDVARRFISGDIAMMENGPWVFSMLDAAGIEYELAPMPRNKRHAVILGGENLGIIKGKNVDGAISFIKYCMEDGGTEDFCKDAYLLPARKESATNLIKEIPSLQIIDKQMNFAIPRTDIEEYTGISQGLPRNFSKVVTGDMTAEEAAVDLLY